LSTELTAVDPMPYANDVSLQSLTGERIQLSELRGKVVLVTLWAMWCPPCIEQFRGIQTAWERLQGQPFEVLALNVGDDATQINAFLGKLPITIGYPVMVADVAEVESAWKFKVLPTTFILNKQGQIAYLAVGATDFASDPIVNRLDQLMKEPTLFEMIERVDTGDVERTSDSKAVAYGRTVYEANCQVCHGVDAAGTADWQKPDEDGRYPPPPLNGTAHTWHHDRDVLRRIILNGTKDIGGNMPAWSDILSDDDVDRVMEWLTSLWPDRVYDMWSERNSQ
jgi:mono/diheme cytochrome c family protein/peroxiredoxin